MSDETMQVARQHRALVPACALEESQRATAPRHVPEQPAPASQRVGDA